MTQSDLEWPRTAMEIVWMTQYDFNWVKFTSASPFWGLSDLDILIYSDSVTSQRETTILCNESTWIICNRSLGLYLNLTDDNHLCHLQWQVWKYWKLSIFKFFEHYMFRNGWFSFSWFFYGHNHHQFCIFIRSKSEIFNRFSDLIFAKIRSVLCTKNSLKTGIL